MLPKTDFIKTNSCQLLTANYLQMIKLRTPDLFKADSTRFEKYSIQTDIILLDYSKNLVNDETIRLLLGLIGECQVSEATRAMLSGEKINATEGRSVLHTALRNRSNTPVLSDGKDVISDVNRVLQHMKEFSDLVISGHRKGFTGKQITNVHPQKASSTSINHGVLAVL